MLATDQRPFWNELGPTKDFTDPFYSEHFLPSLSKNSRIIEYGCGYGRVLNQLWEMGYRHTVGFDFAEQMIRRGQTAYPHLDLRLVNGPEGLGEADAALLITVLVCNPQKATQHQIVQAIYKALKPQGLLYVTDFLASDHRRYLADDYGCYCTQEGAIVRHSTPNHIQELFSPFKALWYHEEEFVTMNNNPARTFHAVYQKYEFTRGPVFPGRAGGSDVDFREESIAGAMDDERKSDRWPACIPGGDRPTT